MKRLSVLVILAILCWTLVPATPTRTVDGDTVDVVVETWLGFGAQPIRAPERIRLLGVNTPERGQPGYTEAIAFTNQWLGLAPGSTAQAITLNDVCKRDSFGRVLATVKRADGRSLGADLLSAGLAKPYP